MSLLDRGSTPLWRV